jgi:acyl-CoA thioesterase-1
MSKRVTFEAKKASLPLWRRIGLFVLSTLMLSACANEAEQSSQQVQSEINNTFQESTKDEGRKIILFFGNSLTAGYGLELSEAFPALIQSRIDSLGLPYLCVNAGLSGETTASGNNRIEWVLEQPVEILVLELGGNDGLRGISTAETSKNLGQMIEKARQKYPDIKILLAGMQVPPNMGAQYAGDFAQIHQNIARKYNTALIPFLLEGVGGEPELNLPDGIHPTAEGHRIVAETVWQYLKPLLSGI